MQAIKDHVAKIENDLKQIMGSQDINECHQLAQSALGEEQAEESAEGKEEAGEPMDAGEGSGQPNRPSIKEMFAAKLAAKK